MTDPLYGNKFDLNTLRKVGGSDYQVEGGGFTFLINVCGKLNTGSDACLEAGSCQTKVGSDNINAGSLPTPIYIPQHFI